MTMWVNRIPEPRKLGITPVMRVLVSTSITIESGVEFRTQGRTEVYNQEIIVAFGARILSLMNRRVVELRAGEDKILSFEFDEGSVLTLRPDDTGYESYTVNLPNGSVFAG